jgi:hypothetical protein
MTQRRFVMERTSPAVPTEFDAIMKVTRESSFVLEGVEPLCGDSIWLGPTQIFTLRKGEYGITGWNDPEGEPILHGPSEIPTMAQEDILALVETHKVAIWIKPPPKT